MGQHQDSFVNMNKLSSGLAIIVGVLVVGRADRRFVAVGRRYSEVKANLASCFDR